MRFSIKLRLCPLALTHGSFFLNTNKYLMSRIATEHAHINKWIWVLIFWKINKIELHIDGVIMITDKKRWCCIVATNTRYNHEIIQFYFNKYK